MLSETIKNISISSARPAWVDRVLRVEWLGQTIASVCWIASVFACGISSSGDYLQLFAATAWLIANIAAVLVNRSNQGTVPSVTLTPGRYRDDHSGRQHAGPAERLT